MLRNDDGTMMSWSAGEEGTLVQHPTFNCKNFISEKILPKFFNCRNFLNFSFLDYQTAQSLRNQMQQLMIGGKIPAVARGRFRIQKILLENVDFGKHQFPVSIIFFWNQELNYSATKPLTKPIHFFLNGLLYQSERKVKIFS